MGEGWEGHYYTKDIFDFFLHFFFLWFPEFIVVFLFLLSSHGSNAKIRLPELRAETTTHSRLKVEDHIKPRSVGLNPRTLVVVLQEDALRAWPGSPWYLRPWAGTYASSKDSPTPPPTWVPPSYIGLHLSAFTRVMKKKALMLTYRLNRGSVATLAYTGRRGQATC